MNRRSLLLLVVGGCSGSIQQNSGPDGSVVAPDAPVVAPDGPAVRPDARVTAPDAPVVAPDAPVVAPDAPVTMPDAMLPPDAKVTPDAMELPPATCNEGLDPHADVPDLVFFHGYQASGDESWLSAPAVADLDRDGVKEIVAGRGGRLVAWEPDGSVKWKVTPSGGRIWASPVIADFVGDADLEVVVGSRENVFMFDAAGNPAFPAPVTWRDEIRAIGAADIDGDHQLEIVTVTTRELIANNQADIIQVFRGDGSVQPGYPPNTTGTSGCDQNCFVHGGFDQTLALGDIDGDGQIDIWAPHDNAYMSWHHGSGVAFDAAAIFANRKKVPGIRGMLDYALAQQGYGADSDLQAHFTNSAPAIFDFDDDGVTDLVVLGSVQNVAQTEREKGVVVFVLHEDGTRPAGWVTPFYDPGYLAGLWDPGDNIVGITQEVAVADLDPGTKGRDIVFVGFDGKIHAVGADRVERWAYTYTTDPAVFASGPVIADLTQDGVPEIVFTTYSTDSGKSALFVLDALGRLQRKLDLPGRGAMPAPTVADLDGDGQLEIVVALKDADLDGNELLAWTVPGSGTACLPWPMVRHDLRRTGSP